MRSWSETQALAERAALGAGVPFAQAARFGAAVARHLSEGRGPEMVAAALSQPSEIVALSLAVEEAVEAASRKQVPHVIVQKPAVLVASFLQSLPCDVELAPHADGLSATVRLDAQQKRARAARIDVPDALWSQMEVLAARTYVPESEASRARGAGAGLMELD